MILHAAAKKFDWVFMEFFFFYEEKLVFGACCYISMFVSCVIYYHYIKNTNVKDLFEVIH